MLSLEWEKSKIPKKLKFAVVCFVIVFGFVGVVLTLLKDFGIFHPLFTVIFFLLLFGGIIFGFITSYHIKSDMAGPTWKKAELRYWPLMRMEDESVLVEKWNKLNRKIQIKVEAMPGYSTSEEATLMALLQGTIVDIAGNLEVFFGWELAERKQLIALDTFPGFNDVIEARAMKNLLSSIQAPDEHIYVLPLWWIPALFVYNAELMLVADFEEPPKTFNEFYKFANNIVIPGKRYAIDFDPSPGWWTLAYYLHSIYSASTEGGHILWEKEFKIDTEVGKEIAKFINTCWREGYASTKVKDLEFEKGEVAVKSMVGAGSFLDMRRKYPQLKLIASPPPVPDWVSEDQPRYVDASVKGVGIFSQSKYPNEAWEFLRWRLTSLEADIAQLKDGYFPCRGDLLINPAFREFFETCPGILPYAGILSRSGPTLHRFKIKIYEEIGNEYWRPLVYGLKSPQQAIEDAKRAVNRILS